MVLSVPIQNNLPQLYTVIIIKITTVMSRIIIYRYAWSKIS